jgi:hypothetical protein
MTRAQTIDEVLVGSSPHRYICEIHREIFDFIESNIAPEKVDRGLNLVAEAYWCGKRMSDRLNELKKNWQYGEHWEKNTDYLSDLARRAVRISALKHISCVDIGPVEGMPPDRFVRVARQLSDYEYSGKIGLCVKANPSGFPRFGSFVKTIRKILPTLQIEVVNLSDGFDCVAPHKTIAFSQGADLLLCQAKGAPSFGSVMDNPLSLLLDGSEYRGFYQTFKEGKSPEICRECRHRKGPVLK